ncbi:hypothetical protein ElyMa_000134900 [Elysia marginata]|uniref:Uncharacterized protein n=1 Tax=Elysia marginata TaxID=1093978 RepID=A0AAV4EQ90_9GAST|nr:hypothetical protein ElyMa_000134900 [Elysia marginata]
MSEKSDSEVELTSIQGHRMHHPEEEIKHHRTGIEGWMIITSAAEKTKDNFTIGGVGNGRTALLDCEAYNNMISVGSDCRTCRAKLRPPVKCQRLREHSASSHNYKLTLMFNQDIVLGYIVIAVLGNKTTKTLCTAETTYNNVTQAHQEAAEVYIPLTPRKKETVLWENKEIV